MQQNLYTKIILALIITSSLKGFDRSHFYRASSFWSEPRFARDKLTSFDLQLTGGSTIIARNECAQKVDLLSIYSHENKCEIPARFSIFEINMNFYQNFTEHFFLHFHAPFAFIQLCWQPNLTPNTGHFENSKNQNTDETWASSITNRDVNCPLIPRHLKPKGIRASGASDCTLFLGSTMNYENTQVLDFVDTTLQAGLLFPTTPACYTSIFNKFPLGYNGHYAFALNYDASIGILDWITLGMHADALFFFDKEIKVNGQITTAHSKPLWRIGNYIKADHFVGGLSFLLAFTYEKKERTLISSFTDLNNQLKSWSRAIFHVVLDYDFSKVDNQIGPRIIFSYNKNITGKRIFQTNTLTTTFALDINWCF